MECRQAFIRLKMKRLLILIFLARIFFATKICAQDELSLPNDILREAIIAESESAQNTENEEGVSLEEDLELELKVSAQEGETNSENVQNDAPQNAQQNSPESENAAPTENLPATETASKSDAPPETFETETSLIVNENPSTSLIPIDGGTEQHYYITEDAEKKPKIFQRLSWKKIKYVKTYKIIVEKITTGPEGEIYEQILDYEPKNNFIGISLEAGVYRFKIGVIDVFDRQKESEWKIFEVLKAFNPKIFDIFPKEIVLNENRKQTIRLKTQRYFSPTKFSKRKEFKQQLLSMKYETITVTGENLLLSTSFKLQRKSVTGKTEEIVGTILEIERDQENEDLRIAKVQFPIFDFVEADYVLVASNPGGLFTSFSKLNTCKKNIRNWKLQMSAGYMLPIELYDDEIAKFTNKKVSPASAQIKFSVMKYETKIGTFGFGANLALQRLFGKTEFYKFGAIYFSTILCALYQNKIIPGFLNFGIHGGLGYACLGNIKFQNKLVQTKSPALTSSGFVFAAGLSFQIFPTHKDSFYVEPSLDVYHTGFRDLNYLTFSPAISVGGRF